MLPSSVSFIPAKTAKPVPALNLAVLPRIWPHWVLLTFLIFLAVAPATTKLAGAAWLLIVLLGLWAALQFPVTQLQSHELVKSSRIWLITCLTAMLLQAFATWYWADPWGDRHVEIRLLLAAGATYSLMRRLSLSPHQKVWLTHALAFACWVALGITIFQGRTTPSNPIPWAAGVSFFVCVLLPLALRTRLGPGHRAVWILAVLAGTAAVLLSLSRGSYGLLPWVIGLIGMAFFKWVVSSYKFPSQIRLKSAATWLAGTTIAFMLFALIVVSFPRIHEEPVGRIQQAWNEIKRTNADDATQADFLNSSVGARLHLWRKAVLKIGEAPLLGHGTKARIAWIDNVGQTDGSEMIKTLSHLHSDPLNTTFEHGFFGLASYLSLSVGLAWLALRKHCSRQMRTTLAGVLWMHLTSGLTNMNFGHNYYGVMLATSISLAWLLSEVETTETKNQLPSTQFTV